ncbi:Cbp/p300-interacting transactivator 1 [Lemmus lemmus]
MGFQLAPLLSSWDPSNQNPPFNLHPVPHLLTSMQPQKLNSQCYGIVLPLQTNQLGPLQNVGLGAQAGRGVSLSPSARAQSPVLIDSKQVDEEVQMPKVLKTEEQRHRFCCK